MTGYKDPHMQLQDAAFVANELLQDLILGRVGIYSDDAAAMVEDAAKALIQACDDLRAEAGHSWRAGRDPGPSMEQRL